MASKRPEEAGSSWKPLTGPNTDLESDAKIPGREHWQDHKRQPTGCQEIVKRLSQESQDSSGRARGKEGGGCTSQTRYHTTDSYRQGEGKACSPDEPTAVSVHRYDASFAENAKADDRKNDRRTNPAAAPY